MERGKFAWPAFFVFNDYKEKETMSFLGSTTSMMNIKVRVSRFELFPKDVPRDYKVGFVVTHTRNKSSRYFEGIVPISSIDNNLNEEEIAVIAWHSVKSQVCTWYKTTKGIIGYTFEIPEGDFEKMIELGIESGLYTSNNLYQYLGIPIPSGSNSESNVERSIPSHLLSERQLF